MTRSLPSFVSHLKRTFTHFSFFFSVSLVLQRIKEAEKNTEEETKLAEVEKILENIISMSRKV